MQKRDLARLDRILALLGSDQPGERASAALAADAFLKKHKLTWSDILEGRAQPAATRRRELGVDYLEAAESRIRQLKRHNEGLEQEVSRLKARIETLKARLAAETEPG